MGDIATIGNTYIDFGLDIEMIAGKILEILVEQGTVQDSARAPSRPHSSQHAGCRGRHEDNDKNVASATDNRFFY